MSVAIDPQVDRKVLAKQIGMGNVFAISGGRINPIEGGIELPVSNGYRVYVQLQANDLYRVARVYKRGVNFSDKKVWEDVYCDEVGEIAYQASCFRND